MSFMSGGLPIEIHCFGFKTFHWTIVSKALNYFPFCSNNFLIFLDHLEETNAALGNCSPAGF